MDPCQWQGRAVAVGQSKRLGAPSSALPIQQRNGEAWLARSFARSFTGPLSQPPRITGEKHRLWACNRHFSLLLNGNHPDMLMGQMALKT